MKKYFILILTILLVSCYDQGPIKNKPREISNYKVAITYSSFFNCGDYRRIIIDNNWVDDPVYKSSIKNYHLYDLDITGNCHEKTRIDTQSVKITTIQSDSIFKLANSYVNNYMIYNPNFTGMRTIVLDGSDIKVEVCYENKCKTVTIYHYDKMSKDLLNLVNYIDSIK
jgi:hypothetical protein